MTDAEAIMAEKLTEYERQIRELIAERQALRERLIQVRNIGAMLDYVCRAGLGDKL
jgi:hypothetical protein